MAYRPNIIISSSWPKWSLLLLILTILTVVSPAESFSTHEEFSNVLLLDSFDENAAWPNGVKEGIKAVISEHPGIQLYTVHAPSTELNAPEFEQAVANLLRLKNKWHQFKAIISSGIGAKNFLLNHGNDLFPNTPIIFIQTLTPLPKSKTPPNSVSLVIKIDLADTLVAALHLLPSTKNVYFISGTSQIDTAFMARSRLALKPFEKHLNLKYITIDDIDTIVKITSNLPPDSIIYPLSITSDKAENKILTLDTIRHMSAHANAPMFSSISTHLEAGTVGGKVITPESLGRATGDTLVAMLEHRAMQTPRIITIPSQYIFDWRRLRAWNIPESRLPAASRIINKPISFFTLYKWRIIGALALILSQSLVIILLLFLRAQRRKAEEALRKSEEKFSTAFQESPSWVVLSSLDDGTYIEVNEAFLQTTGFTRDEVIGRTSVELATWENPQEREDLIQRIKTRGYVRNEQVLRRTKNGNLLNMWVSGDIIEIQGQKCLLSMSMDITNRIKAEAELRESESRLRAILVANPDPVVVYDAQGCPIFINPAFTGVFGWTFSELDGRQIPFVPDDQKELTGQKIKELYESGIPVQFETKRLTREGRTLDILISAAIVRDNLGHSTGMVVNLNDITERKRIAVQLRQTQKMEAIGTLAGGIAHDFNNLLGAIIGYTELVQMDLNEDSPAGQQLNQVLKAAGRAKNLVGQILTYSRKTERELRPVKITPILKETLQFLRASIPTTIAIRTEFKSENDVVSADPTQINQILMNLGTNAAHAMEEYGGTFRVALENVWLDREDIPAGSNLHPGYHVRLTVSDDGQGMDKETQSRIFEPYFTTKEPGEGTGLGLSVVHGIVVSIGGDIRLYSEPGLGTTFHIYLPVTSSDIEKIPEWEPVQIQTGRESIMFVDDETVLSDLGKKMLEHLGYRVTNYLSGSEALTAFQNNPAAVDLVITDQTMPQMTGLEMAREMVRIRPDIPIILCTGFSRQVSQEKLDEIGIKGFLYKPVVMKDLAAAIRSALDSNDKQAESE